MRKIISLVLLASLLLQTSYIFAKDEEKPQKHYYKYLNTLEAGFMVSVFFDMGAIYSGNPTSIFNDIMKTICGIGVISGIPGLLPPINKNKLSPEEKTIYEKEISKPSIGRKRYLSLFDFTIEAYIADSAFRTNTNESKILGVLISFMAGKSIYNILYPKLDDKESGGL